MYARQFQKAGQVKRFTISSGTHSGWDVRQEEDSRIVWQVRYTDWHKVERARLAFAREAATLASAGWQES